MESGGKLGRYELGRRLGAGTMSQVFVARHPLLDREVAIKVLREEWREDEEYVARFLTDARAAHALNHPNIVRVLDIEDSHVRPFIVMDLVDGEPLENQCTGQIGFLSAARIGCDIASALAAAHAGGLIHRDVKPSNVLIERRTGLSKLTDFGAAKRMRAGNLALVEVDKRIGTPRYMAPEQVDGRKVSARTDLFALGATLYKLLAGRHAFERHTAGAVFAAILFREPPPLEQFRPDVPPQFADLIRHMLSKRAEDRPTSAEEVLATLERLAHVILPLANLPVQHFEPGMLLLQAGTISNQIFVLKDGALEISRDGVRLSVVEEPGTILGELAVLLQRPHAADVRPIRRSAIHVANAPTFFEKYPAVTLHVATGLARKLEAADLRLLQIRGKLEPKTKVPGSMARMLETIRDSLRSALR